MISPASMSGEKAAGRPGGLRPDKQVGYERNAKPSSPLGLQAKDSIELMPLDESGQFHVLIYTVISITESALSVLLLYIPI